MSLAQVLQQSGAIGAMARELGIDEQTARTGANALIPAIVAGMGRSSAGGGAGGDPLGGLGGLGSILAGGAGGGLLDAVLNSSPTPVEQGNDILGNIFGNKDVSRSVTAEAAASTGIGQDLLKRMLPILAMAAFGYLMQRGRGGSGGGMAGSSAGPDLGGILGSIVGGLANRR